MTCREKLKIEHPAYVAENWLGGCKGCPDHYGYLPRPRYCKYYNSWERCKTCWDREIPGTEEIKEEVKMEKERRYYTCTEIDQMPDFAKNGLIVRLRTDICNKDEECKKLMLKNDALNTSLRAKDSVIEEKDKEIEKLKNENKNLVESNYVLNDHIIEYELVIKESDKEKDELKDKNRKLKDERDWVDKCYHNCAEESRHRAEKIRALENDIECRKKDLEYKNDQIEDLIKRLDDQRKKIEDLENGDVLPYFIRKVVGDKLKVDPFCWATPAEKCNYIKDAICKSVPCSEAIKQLEKKVDDIPCIKAKNTKNELDDAIKDYIMKSPKPVCWDDYWPINHLGELNLTDPTYDKTATHMMRKYKALRNAGFDHDDAMSLIPMWSDE